MTNKNYLEYKPQIELRPELREPLLSEKDRERRQAGFENMSEQVLRIMGISDNLHARLISPDKRTRVLALLEWREQHDSA